MTVASVLYFGLVLYAVVLLYIVGYFYKGQHRGEYVEKPEWKPSPWKQLDNGILIWNRPVTLKIGNAVPTGVATLSLTPDDGALTIPALIGPARVPGEEEIREYINHELCSTPIFTGLKYGRFGDSDFDMADSAPLCVTAKTWLPGDPE